MVNHANGQPIFWDHNSDVLRRPFAPHFHAYYGNDAAKIDIDTLHVSEGKLRRRPLALVLEWAVEHRHELHENWRLAEVHRPLNPIDPLE